jgi:ABC-type oligopeptide transport system substrate-binding subunit
VGAIALKHMVRLKSSSAATPTCLIMFARVFWDPLTTYALPVTGTLDAWQDSSGTNATIASAKQLQKLLNLIDEGLNMQCLPSRQRANEVALILSSHTYGLSLPPATFGLQLSVILWNIYHLKYNLNTGNYDSTRDLWIPRYTPLSYVFYGRQRDRATRNLQHSRFLLKPPNTAIVSRFL